MGFLAVGDPTVQASMRGPQIIPVERIDATVKTSTNHNSECRLYYTPQLASPAVAHPGRPPAPPTAPKPLRPKRAGDSNKYRKSLVKHYNNRVEKYNAALAIYRTTKAAWEELYKEYTDSIDLENITNEDEDKVDEEEDDNDTDPIAAANPITVFTHGRKSTLEDAHITAFCQLFAREAAILLFEDLRPELQRIHVFRTLVDTYPSIKAFSGRSAGARNATKASSKTLFDSRNSQN